MAGEHKKCASNQSFKVKIFKFLLFSILLQSALGQDWQDDWYEVMNDEEFTEEKMYMEKVAGSGAFILHMEEEFPPVPDREFPMLRLKLTVPAKDVELQMQGNDLENKVKLIRTVDDEDNEGFWYIHAVKRFDYEVNFDPIPIILQINNANPKQFYLQVEDINDNEPEIIERRPPKIDPIEELTPPSPNPIFTVVATDKDKNDALVFSLSENDDGTSDFFEIDTATGDVTQIKELDYEAQSSHRIVVSVSDGLHTTDDIITVYVKDMPNLPPVFTRTPVIPPIPEEVELGFAVVEIHARDGDTQLNWDIIYSLEDKHDLLQIDEKTGIITVKNRIDAESEELIEEQLSYSITITAREVINAPDCPDCKETSEDVVVTITDINDQEPKLCQEVENPLSRPRQISELVEQCESEMSFSFRIPEDHTGSINLEQDAIIRVKDLDSTTAFNTFETRIVTSDADEFVKNAFAINPSRGSSEETFTISVISANAIDFENDDGHWRNPDGTPKEISFQIEFIGTNDPSHRAIANIKATVTDVNDNPPIFELNGESQFEFTICENMEDGEDLYHFKYKGGEDGFPNACRDSELDYLIEINAVDKDISSEEFGQASVIYQWSDTGRKPPVHIDRKTGRMKMELYPDGSGFDYERLTEEFFVVEAKDSEGAAGAQVSIAYVKFTILDKNDMNVELRFGRISAEIEEGPWTDPVLEGITAKDVDVTADIELTMELSDSMHFDDTDEGRALKEEVEKWFTLRTEGGGGDVSGTIFVTDGQEPDREGGGAMDIDRVELIITAEDRNSETDGQGAVQSVTIIIKDCNDNPPSWPPDENYDGETLTLQETEDPDMDTDTQREIQRFRVVDPDTGTRFEFRLENPSTCEPNLGKDVCDRILDSFELTKTNNISGTTVLARKKDRPIDREDKSFFPDPDELDRKLGIVFIASDSENELSSTIFIEVTDINDNNPQFEKDYTEEYYEINENVDLGFHIETIHATDEDHPDRYGKVSYLIEEYREAGDNDGQNKFRIDENTGEITTSDEFDWFDVQTYQLQIKAIDDYRGGNSDLSRYNITHISIVIKDTNSYPPNFITEEGTIIVAKETEVEAGVAFDTEIQAQDRDDPSQPNGEIHVTIQDVERIKGRSNGPDPKTLFSLVEGATEEKNIKNLKIIPQTSFVGLWGEYRLTLRAEDGKESYPGQLWNTSSYLIEIENENLNAPDFIFPPVDNTIIYQLSIRDQEPSQTLIDITNNGNTPVQNVHAIDLDEGSGDNGVIIYRLEKLEDDAERPEHCPLCQDCSDLFAISNEEGEVNGRLTLREKLGEVHSNMRCLLNIIAEDQAPEDSKMTKTNLIFFLAWYKNTPPAFPSFATTISIKENQTENIPYVDVEDYALDPDIETRNLYFPDDKVNYFFKGGEYRELFTMQTDSRVFPGEDGKEITRQVPVISPVYPLDRETKDEYKFVLYATNEESADDIVDVDVDKVEEMNNKQYTVVTVTVLDIIDTAPKFEATNDTITGGFSESSRINDTIRTALVIDPDFEDRVEVEMIGGFRSSDQSLPMNPAPFKLIPGEKNETEGTLGVAIELQFDPQPSYKGFYEFTLRATDSIGYQGQVTCKMYMVTRQNVVHFYFNNTDTSLIERQELLTQILSDAFGNQCNIDRITRETADTQISQQPAILSKVDTHFINMNNNEPMSGSAMAAKRYDPEVLTPLLKNLNDNEFYLINNGIQGPEEPTEKTDPKDMIMYILIGGVAVLGVTLLIVGATCFYNNRGLTRRVRALTATTFGSQQSDLNRAGTQVAPNTNTFAIEGSNPVWTVDADVKKLPFDTESVGSGGSILIGAEDEDYFQKNKFQAEDIVANYESEENYYNEPSYYNTRGHDEEEPEPVPLPIHFAARSSKNPLVNLEGFRKSINVDDINGHDDDASEISEASYNSIKIAQEDTNMGNLNDNFTMY